ncbi:unnamed protein product [Timema podura]|uniref:EF-hand domain-containing protein n=1 Tax=Timema podura TaxID=61482 RepID=A0ABN7NS86_TIMPD|nr:unnamed protein product [Timema podura]
MFLHTRFKLFASSTPDQDSNLNFPAIGSLVYCVNSVLDHVATEAGLSFPYFLKRKKINDVSEDKLIEYTDTMLQVFDANKDGRLQLSEMAKGRGERLSADKQEVSQGEQLIFFPLFLFRTLVSKCAIVLLRLLRLLPVKENFLCRQIFKVSEVTYRTGLSSHQCRNAVFGRYSLWCLDA